jgi:hypothetical protein
MIPTSGSMHVLSSVAPATAAITGNITFTTHITNHPLTAIVTAATAVDAIRTAPFVFLAAAPFATGTRITDTKSPIAYNVTGMTWSAGTLTLTHAILPVAAVASVATQQIHISNSSNTTKVPNGVYTTVSSASQTTTQTLVSLATDPGQLTSVTASIQPGIIPTNGDNRGYYTINIPAVTTSTAVLTNPAWAVNTVPPAATHAVLVASTNTNYVAQIVLDGIRDPVFVPANQFVCLRNLKAGSFYRANGATATDLARIIFCNHNPFSNS